MKLISHHQIREYFYQIYNDELSIEQIEAWVYAQSELEGLLAADDYLTLISMDYQAHDALDRVSDLVSLYVDVSAFHTYRLIRGLKLVLSGTRDPDVLSTIVYSFYNDYCHGYHFMKNLGMNFGLRIGAPLDYADQVDDMWADLSPIQQQRLIDALFPEIEPAARQVLDWLLNQEIVITAAPSIRRDPHVPRDSLYLDRRSGAGQSSELVEPLQG